LRDLQNSRRPFPEGLRLRNGAILPKTTDTFPEKDVHNLQNSHPHSREPRRNTAILPETPVRQAHDLTVRQAQGLRSTAIHSEGDLRNLQNSRRGVTAKTPRRQEEQLHLRLPWRFGGLAASKLLVSALPGQEIGDPRREASSGLNVNRPGSGGTLIRFRGPRNAGKTRQSFPKLLPVTLRPRCIMCKTRLRTPANAEGDGWRRLSPHVVIVFLRRSSAQAWAQGRP
jgi:hypothetical protein